MDRRTVLKGSTILAAGLVGAGAVLAEQAVVAAATADAPLPLYRGIGATVHPDRRTPPVHRSLGVHWGVDTERKLVALTFDDGPMPDWTPRVLDILDEQRIPATFFMVGSRVRDHGALVRGRLARHEVGNHTWAHHDLAKLDYQGARAALEPAHHILTELVGREPVLMRPPYGHLCGSTLLAANDLGYAIVLWNLQMLESDYAHRPAELVNYIVNAVSPGTVLLAHDTGPADRLVAIGGLPDMISGLVRRGYEFVTVSQLLAYH